MYSLLWNVAVLVVFMIIVEMWLESLKKNSVYWFLTAVAQRDMDKIKDNLIM